ncbi:MAG: Taurine-binding periplasmic protein TauA [Pseudomonadota bacterium]
MQAFAADDSVTVACQTVVEPAKIAQADGLHEKATGKTIHWRKFESGTEVITAVASGDVQIGYVGSSPLAAAASRKLPVETFLIAAEAGSADALVVRNGAGIVKANDLVDRKVAVPFVSTTHYNMSAVRALAVKVVFPSLAAFFPVVLNTFEGIRSVPPELLEVARVLRFTRVQTWRKLILPAASPSILAGIHLGLIHAWLATLGAE